MKKNRTTADFINDAKKVHGNRYDYSLSAFTRLKDKVKIICATHGIFEQSAGGHLAGKGCLKCFHDEVRARKMTTAEFISKAKKVHGDLYDYSECEYLGHRHKVKLICKKHGVFFQSPNNHTQGYGCPQCGKEKNCAARTLSKKDFVERAMQVHGNKYDYSNTKYKSIMDNVDVSCPVHGLFSIRPNNHISSRVGCPKCAAGSNKSSLEFEVADILKSQTGLNWVHGDRSVISPKELDLVCHETKLAIEINGEYWHSEINGKRISYHLDKTNTCKAKGFRLLQFTYSEVERNLPLVINMIKQRCGIYEEKIMARKCSLKDVDIHTAKEFCNVNHLKGYGNSSVRKGLFFNNELVGLACFVKPRFAKDKYDFELARLCFKQGVVILGGVSKLIKSLGCGVSLVSYCDLRYSDGDSYIKAGFNLSHQSKPSYVWVKNSSVIFSRYDCQKHKLAGLLGDSFRDNLTEKENMEAAGFSRMWDCGNLVFNIML